jgi:adenosine deaminase
LGITVHVGETPDSPASDIIEIIEIARPHRIGHGIQAAFSEEALRLLHDRNICLEICPTSNVQTHAVTGLEQLAVVLRTFREAGVPFTINTDNPYLSLTNLRYEIELLLNNSILSREELLHCFEVANAFSFIP